MKVMPLVIAPSGGPVVPAAHLAAAAASTSLGRQPAAIGVLALGGLAAAVLSALALRAAGDAALYCNYAQQLVAVAAAIGALLIVRRAGDAEQRRVRGVLAAAMALGSIGFIIWDSGPDPIASLIAAECSTPR